MATHNWPTSPNRKDIDRQTDRLARAMIDRCVHLTPAVDARMDNLLTRLAPMPDDKSVCEPDAEALREAEGKYDWMNEVEPEADELAEIEAEDH